jgi:lipid-A-disaccharide synthase-like uncharacterized protein
MMGSLHDMFWSNGNFQWWEIVGWLGNFVFFTRFFVQWYATEKKKQVVVPTAFWWLSLSGSVLLLFYALFARAKSGHSSWVFVASYAFNWLPYVRNLIIHRRHADAHLPCPQCETVCPPKSNFCFECGARLTTQPAAPAR